MPESDGKGTRVTGFFILLLGAGVILDSAAHGLGAVIALSGAVLLGWGVVRATRRRPTALADASAERS
jgi:hypothetical protein